MGIIELGMLTCDSWVGDGSDWRGRKNIAGKGRCLEQGWVWQSADEGTAGAASEDPGERI